MVNIKLALDAEISARRKAQSYAKMSGSELCNRLKRLFLKPHIYLPHLLARLGLWENNLKGRTFWGRKFIVPFRDGDARLLYHFGTLVGPEFRLIRYFLRSLKSHDVFYDVGANYGFYSMLAQEIITDGQIHSFEPLSNVFEYLRENTANFPGTKIYLNRVALSDRNGPGNIFDATSSLHSGASSLISESLSERNEASVVSKVEMMKLDDYVQKNKLPTIVKIDVEGGEHLVLNGGKKFLNEQNPMIFMEVWGGQLGEKFSKPSIELLKSWGYKPYRLSDEGVLETKEATDIFSRSDNLVFVKDSSQASI